MGITVIGLGPGSSKYLTREAWDILSTLPDLYVRTQRHPAVAELPQKVRCHGFDHVYESESDFTTVYGRIVEDLISLGQEADIVYAVPGNPFVGESTVTRLLSEAEARHIPVRIVPGLSFIEPVLSAVGLDVLDGLQIYDALAVAERLYPLLNADLPILLGQVYNRHVAGEVKQALTASFSR